MFKYTIRTCVIINGSHFRDEGVHVGILHGLSDVNLLGEPGRVVVGVTDDDVEVLLAPVGLTVSQQGRGRIVLGENLDHVRVLFFSVKGFFGRDVTRILIYLE